jgi:hypothetical protein
VRIDKREVKLTNLDKVFFPAPGLTKGDVIRYYLDVAPCVLHHVRNRPMQMLRYPDGVDGLRFYQEVKPDGGGTRFCRYLGGEAMSATRTIRTAEVTLDLLFERYRTRLINRNRSPQAISNFTRSVVPFQHWLSEQDIRPEAVVEEHLYAYFNSPDYPYAPGTRRLHAVQIRAAYRYGTRRVGFPALIPLLTSSYLLRLSPILSRLQSSSSAPAEGPVATGGT